MKYLIEIEVNERLRGQDIDTEILSILDRLSKDIRATHAVDGMRLVNSGGMTVGWARFSGLG